jgi:arabinose-5-phosphate isomerase
MNGTSGMSRPDVIQAALRAIGTERDGLSQLEAAFADGGTASELAAAFFSAVSAIHNARGRVIVTGMGKSGHVGRKIASTFASTGTPCRGQPRRPRHGGAG